MLKTNYFLSFLFLLTTNLSFAQDWQQKADYVMNISVDVQNYRYTGEMDFTYHNHSPDELKELYFHLYFNAFQPRSVMNQRLSHITDPDRRMVNTSQIGERRIFKSKIDTLQPQHQGYQKILSLRQGNQNLEFSVQGTILKVVLKKPIQPKSSAKLEMKWEAQIPPIIRRAGKLNQEGVAFSMAQWYPKVAAYDRAGWHLDEYVAREFYAPFGDFDVKIKLPQKYIVGASGKLINANEMPGYGQAVKRKWNTWHFKAENIHDFAWAADPDFVVDSAQSGSSPQLYFVYKNSLAEAYKENWKKVQPLTLQFFEFMNQRFGEYPWETYSIVQGGDGGMEYGTSTLVTGERSLESLAGLIFHEGAHSWFQHLFGIDETQNEWMDEGFTSYAETKAMAAIVENKNPDGIGVHQDAYNGYYNLIQSNVEEPLSLLADYFRYNYTYGISAYSKGQVFVAQLGYIIGEEALRKTFLQFYKRWKFKHPDEKDFIKIATKVSDIHLKWYNNLFINTTRHIDYGIESVEGKKISLRNYADFPMPLDVLVTFKDGSQKLFYIPLHAMRGHKTFEKEYYPQADYQALDFWAWASPTYSFEVEKEIQKVEIDPTKRLADYRSENNIYQK